MRARDIFIILMIVVILISVLLFWRKETPVLLPKATMGWNAWPGILPYLVAYEKGFFKNAGVDLELVFEDSYTKMLEDLISEKIDFSGDLALMDIVEKVALGNKIKVIGATDYSNGADGIIVKKEIKGVKELKGKLIAVEKNTLGEYLLYAALKRNDLSFNDVKEVNMSAQDAVKSFCNKEVDAAVTYEPDLNFAVEKCEGKKIFSSADAPGLIVDTLAVKSDFLEKNPQIATAIIKAYFESLDFIGKNNEEAMLIGARYFKINPVEFEDFLKGIEFFDREKSYKYFVFGVTEESIHGNVKEISEYLKQMGKIRNDVDSMILIDSEFIRNIY